MSPGAEKGGSVVVYDFITQYVIYFMGLKPNPIQFYQHDWWHVFSCQNLGKNACLSIVFVILSYIYEETRFPIANCFLGTEANVLLRIFYYNALGAFYEALVQRTGGYTNLLQGCA